MNKFTLTIDNFLALGWTFIKIMSITLPLVLLAGYLSWVERRIIYFIQDRVGPNRVGPYGLLQPLADVLKLLFKEIIFPTHANRYLFIIAPILAVAPALAAWAVIPFDQNKVLANINLGLLYLLTMTSITVYGIVIAGWASNSKYALLGAIRSAAQMISYEISMGFALIGVVMAAKSTNLTEIVLAQRGGIFHWFWIPLLPLFIVYWISAIVETNRAPFDVSEAESELVAGFHVEYSGTAFAVFFLAEYTNMILVSILAATLFLGGWLSPFEGIPIVERWFHGVPGILWLALKASLFLFSFFWIRATFPRYRYDQIMRLGWKIFIPLSIGWIIITAIMLKANIYWFK